MFLTRRRKAYCQNCQYPLTTNYNFCPECGQENSDKLVSFNTLIGDFMSNYFSYDSRLGRSIKPFLFKPGFLTKEFNAGKRTKYMHPLRMYLVVSFFYFLMFSFMVSHEGEDDKMLNFSKIDNTGTFIDDSVLIANKAAIQQATDAIDSSTNNVAIKQVSNAIDSSTNQVSVKVLNEEKYKKGISYNNLQILVKDEVTPEEVLNTYKLEHSPFKLVLAKQAIKLANEREQNVYNFLIKNASIMMFLFLPFFAMLLKLFYIRRNKLYVEHITFALHMHSFMFFILFLVIFIDIIWPNDNLVTIAILLIFTYFLLSIKNVYQQSWIKSVVKSLFLTWGYTISFLVFLVFTVAVSLSLY